MNVSDITTKWFRKLTVVNWNTYFYSWKNETGYCCSIQLTTCKHANSTVVNCSHPQCRADTPRRETALQQPNRKQDWMSTHLNHLSYNNLWFLKSIFFIGSTIKFIKIINHVLWWWNRCICGWLWLNIKSFWIWWRGLSQGRLKKFVSEHMSRRLQLSQSLT